MTRLLYWIVYHFDLGPFGPRVLDLAVQSWLKRAREQAAPPAVSRKTFGFVTSFHLQPTFGADERM